MKKASLFYGFILIILIVFIYCCEKETQEDLPPPVCNIITPADSSKFYIGDTITIDVEADDYNGMVKMVILYIDDRGKFSLKVSPYQFKWSTSNDTVGFHVIRATAFDRGGNSSSDECIIKLVIGPSVVITADISSITNNSAICGGNVTSDGGDSVTARGVCWNTTGEPTLSDNNTNNGKGTGSFSSPITGLSYNTTYYIRAYATNNNGTTYGNTISFTTSAALPEVLTGEVSLITCNSVQIEANVIDDGGMPVIQRGICWSTSSNPTISDNITNDGSGIGPFISNLTGLESGTTYFVRTYATNSTGTAYGNNISFTTSTSEQGTFGEINDVTGDSQGPDLTYACISIKNNNMVLRVEFEQSTFDPQTTCVQFCLDTDCNPSTGHPGMNAGGVNDAEIIGVEYLVNIKHTSDKLQANVKKYKGTVNCFGFVDEVTSTFVDNGMEVIVPCSLISNNNGILNFKLTTQTQLSENTYTGIKDYMTDLGKPVGEVR